MKINLLTFFSKVTFLLFLLSALNSAFALPQISSSQTADCKPYTMTLEPVACGPGYTGVKFPLKIKSCPSGVITTGQSFNTDNCKRIDEGSNPNRTNCAITPTDVSCTSKPAPLGCPSGQHWVTTGSGIAHCVQDDFPCPWGQSLTHDALGNPYCVANTCPSNQVLQADGISCACSAGLVWDGSMCVAACTPSTSLESQLCTTGFTGTRSRTVTVTCPSGTSVYGPWNTSSCVPNAVTCPADEYIPTTCSSGNGTAYVIYSYLGASCVRTYVGLDESGCTSTPPSCPSDTVSTNGCGVGFTGFEVTTTTYLGAMCTPSTSKDRSMCIPDSTPSCPSDTVSTSSCGAGYTGSEVTYRTYVGASCTPMISTDRSACVFVGSSCPSDTVSRNNCGVGYTGFEVETTTYLGALCTPSISIDRSSCFLVNASCPSDTVSRNSCGVGYTGFEVTTTAYVGASCMPSISTDRSACVPVGPSCPSDTVSRNSCGAGYTGQEVTTTTYVGASCTPSTSTDRSSCLPVNPTCPSDTVSRNSCGPGYTGFEVTTTAYVGALCTPSTTTDTSACLCNRPPEITQGTCPAPQNGTTTITTTYSGNSCTASTTVDTSLCVNCSDTPGTESAACGPNLNGIKSRSTSTNSCTRVVTYGVWDESLCSPIKKYCPDGSEQPPSGICPTPIVYVSEGLWRIPSWGATDRYSCSYEVWIFGYSNGDEKKGRGYEISAEMFSKENGSMDWSMGAPGVCNLY